jgi:hypothetical protein
MYNNWYVDERLLKSRYNDLLQVAEMERLLSKGEIKRPAPFYVKTLSKLGETLVTAGFWLQDRYGNMVDFPTLEIDDPCWE